MSKQLHSTRFPFLCCAGFDMDKLDYIIRDQHFIFAADRKKSSNINPSAIIEKALVVQNCSTKKSQIAFFMSPFMQQSINNVFEARAAMHFHVYQKG
jgi:HD superfamily phosphohydrolase